MDVIDITQGANKALAILRGSGAVGYAETNVYGMTADADVTGKVTDSTGSYIKISDHAPAMDEFNDQRLTVVNLNGEISFIELKLGDTVQQLTDEVFGVFEAFLVVNKDGVEIDGVVFPEVGTYVLSPQLLAEYGYESVTVTLETLHPIDPKYLPGVCLPVVELSATLSYDNGYIVPLTLEERAVVENSAASISPVYVIFNIGSTESVVLHMGALLVPFVYQTGEFYYVADILLEGVSNRASFFVEDGVMFFAVAGVTE